MAVDLQVLITHFTDVLSNNPAFRESSFQRALMRNHLAPVVSIQPGLFSLKAHQTRDLLRFQPKPEELARIMAVALSDERMLSRFLNTLSPSSRDLLKLMAWDGAQFLRIVREKHNLSLRPARRFADLPNNDLAVAMMMLNFRLYPEPHLLQPLANMEPSIQAAIRNVGKPAGGRLLRPQPEDEEAFLYEAEDPAAWVHSAYLFMRKPEISALSPEHKREQFAQTFRLNEFFPDIPVLAALRSNMACDFVAGVDGLGREVEPGEFKSWLNRFWSLPKYPLSNFSYHIRPREGMSRPLDAPGYPRIIKRALQLCPTNQWVDADDLFKALYRRDIPLGVVAKPWLYQAEAPGSELTAALIDYPEELLYRPGLYLSMFLMASIGLVDLTHVEPEAAHNPVFAHLPGKWLTPFDGLRQIRLTEMGAFAIDRTEEYHGEWSGGPAAQLEFHSRDLLISLSRRDKVQSQFLSQMAEAIGSNRFLVTPASFLNGLDHRRDLEDRISELCTHMTSEPPDNWQEFFDKLRRHADPAAVTEQYAVLQLAPFPELAHLITRDPVLKSLAIKAEHRMVLVEHGGLPLFRSRLRELGYLP